MGNELQSNNLSDFLAKKKTHTKGKFKLLYPVIILVCLFLGSSTVFAGRIVYNNMKINENKLPELQPMEKKRIKSINAVSNDIGNYDKKYETYDELCSDMGIELLRSDLAVDNSYMLIDYSTDNQNWSEIKITAYITGDIYNIKKDADNDFYTWEKGVEYYSPIDMVIDIISSDSQLEKGWDKDYLGAYEFVETWNSQQGYIVNIIKGNLIKNNDDYPKYIASFVADGIRYELSGRVKIEKMKEIINSLYAS